MGGTGPQVPSKAALRKKKASGLSDEERDEASAASAPTARTAVDHPPLSPCKLILPRLGFVSLYVCSLVGVFLLGNSELLL